MIQTIQPVRRQTIEKRQDVLFERFQAAPTKIALQKDGELTEISRVILAERYGLEVPPRNSRRLMSVSEDGRFGFVYARNKDICRLVSSGAVDIAIVGTDRLIEDGGEATLTVAASYENRYAWSVVLATRGDSNITNPEQIRRVATQYPEITKRYFAGLGLVVPEIIQTAGGTELYPYLSYRGDIDAVVDLSVTGRSLEAHNLVAWTPSIWTVYPVVIQRQGNTLTGIDDDCRIV